MQFIKQTGTVWVRKTSAQLSTIHFDDCAKNKQMLLLSTANRENKPWKRNKIEMKAHHQNHPEIIPPKIK